MKILILLLILTQTLYANNFREENIDLGKGQVLTMINLKHQFWVGKYEVTQGQWLAVMGEPAPASPLAISIHDPRQKRDRRPMAYMGLSLAQDFCKAAGEKTGRKIRLPTEKEWEFYANGTKLEDAVCAVGQKHGLRGPADVGSKGPNRFGLYDTLGNVMEICSGKWEDYVDPKTGRKRQDRPMCTMGRVGPWTPIRGGCHWFNSAVMMKVEFRDFSINQGARGAGGVGMRVVCDGDK